MILHSFVLITFKRRGGSMNQVIGLPNHSYKPITNTAWVRARLCKLRKRVHSTRWFSPGTPPYSTINTSRHDIAEILLKVALNTIKQTNKQTKRRLNEARNELIIYTSLLLQILNMSLPQQKRGADTSSQPAINYTLKHMNIYIPFVFPLNSF